jgi:hypothetical protein
MVKSQLSRKEETIKYLMEIAKNQPPTNEGLINTINISSVVMLLNVIGLEK